MNARANKNSIVITGIANESHKELVSFLAERSKCSVTFENFDTKAIVTGEEKQRNLFIKIWNN